MTTSTLSVDRTDRRVGVAHRIAELVEPLVGGPLPVRLQAWDGSVAGDASAPRVLLRSPSALRRLLWSPGELGAAQAYVTGELDVDGDLAAALDHVWGVVRERRLSAIRPGPASLLRLAKLAKDLGVFGRPLPPPVSQASVKGRLHSVLRDRAAISHHYDLSNDFYELVLDSHMAYSSAYWTSDSPDYTLDDAQRDKLDLVCRKIGLDKRVGQRFLDVGCGWGSLSLHAAQEYGAKVVGVTISREQKAFIDKRIADRGLQDRVEIRIQDYREIPDGPFDAVASIEMGEHVGEANYPTYTAALHTNVKPGGRVLIQQMSRREGDNPGGGAFIESFIAPDMYMRPVGRTVAMIEEAGLEVRDVHALREHYVRTVDVWTERFEARFDDVVAMVGEEVARVWRLYLIGGGMAFRDNRMGVDQILAVRSGSGPSEMEPVRPVWVCPR
ncbi:class I SAM-dependent methyltransferase [Rhodococcus sp. 14-2496-1d]|jgi:cyclopropane-fatty-acyl-phospholipid synthase|uniref:SAM-dependent methyltransferase n=1 Tax=Nocardiaceae TaxID=85025 RepID=UPI0005D7F464|nr:MULTISPECIES: cyclopropane-fatty-acyl-phospholipid synthase family protein [Rhodococcus]AJW39608.1 Cyclopropane-fatty-acyl-phospholipid synthase [Rhodococcus sp. B7740]OZD77913.1 class I SAM-dependent methyltransferase [Rhodococcus sp. 05-339-2]OZE06188.1 class I SAM-dependent methyltransferase [Rhodococcus sp. 05-2255-3B1]OZE07404.1 class I SAM-dependent methyltransferase [Rhodococcus sp. 05-2255-3C]OZE18340.1 class I SAM-dependent methyltransferase [Rhodococcus sp. 05-2255-2A2]